MKNIFTISSYLIALTAGIGWFFWQDYQWSIFVLLIGLWIYTTNKDI